MKTYLILFFFCIASLVAPVFSEDKSINIDNLIGKKGKILTITNGNTYESGNECFVENDQDEKRISITVVSEMGTPMGGPEYVFYYNKKMKIEQIDNKTIYSTKDNYEVYKSLCDGYPMPSSISIDPSRTDLELSDNSITIKKVYFCREEFPPETQIGRNMSEVTCTF